ncbi:hypothetical protein GCM10010168_21410 [Actinoplanes ianthinogenes]|uniref:Histidine kinase n=1 Tax=Actinoplanes ianthinogenes TaxID=122358 RepID=A0ABM7M829_9ACTN|nr:hypothetical protein [Actinoplanes ianthinogenes]BCJ47782.1 hypothetical protein Aiant_84390 [Actinoplanes ianthinogenes]GGR04131.1 hypothetical protein GCM10010168_21410 [Actinoplanes ianthinogenes]
MTLTSAFALVLAVLALIEGAVALVAARRAGRIAADLARGRLDQERRAAALAADLRDELGRLHVEMARLAARTAIAAHPGRRQ